VKYIYTKPMCSACEDLKNKYKEGGVAFVVRFAARLSLDERLMDEIDKEAFMVLQMQNLTFPVEVDTIEY
jgi:glutaredoxin